MFTFSPKKELPPWRIREGMGPFFACSGERDSLEAESASVPLCSWFFIAELSVPMECSENQRVDIRT